MRNIQLFTQNHTLRKSHNCDLSQSLLSVESSTWTSSLLKRDASIIKEPSIVWDTCRMQEAGVCGGAGGNPKHGGANDDFCLS